MSGTLFELFMPIFIVLMLALSSYAADNQQVSASGSFPTFKRAALSDLPAIMAFTTKQQNDTHLQLFRDHLLNYFPRSQLRYFESEDSLESTVRNSLAKDNDTITHAIVIIDWGHSHRPAYKVRISPEVLELHNVEELWNKYPDEARLTQYHVNFLPVQRIVDEYFINSTIPSVQTNQLSYNSYEKDMFLAEFKDYFPWYILVVWLIGSSKLIESIVTEKKERLREAMRIMGVDDISLWLGWIFTFLIQYLVIIVAAVLLLAPMLAKTGGLLLFGVFLLYTLNIAVASTLQSAFYSKPRTAAFLSSFIYIGGYMPFYAVNRPGVSGAAKYFASLIPQVNLGLCIEIMLDAELTGRDVGSSQFAGHIIIFIFVFFLLFFLTVYVDLVIPTELGETRSPCFCIGRERMDVYHILDDEANTIEMTDVTEAIIEPIEESANGVKIENLSKTFKDNGKLVRAVNGLSLTMSEGQIFVLLGTNGAGKTTLINMLTGMVSPTSGNAHIDNLSVRSDVGDIRRRLGFCPQHDILWEDLTCREHLWFYSRLKGIEGGAGLEQEIARCLGAVGLAARADGFTKDLSGGEKRKLSLSIALVGNPRIIFLDEPTAGMDPLSQRLTWSLIREHRQDKVIVLTTHLMHEAEILGDRIGIMANGRLKVCGTSLFLKAHCGVGYVFVLLKEKSAEEGAIAELVRELCPPAAPAPRACPGELAFSAPLGASRHFPELFRQLEERKSALGITSVNVSVTTLQEVFLKLCEGAGGREAFPESAEPASLIQNDHRTDPLIPAQENVFHRRLELRKVHILVQAWYVLLTRIRIIRREYIQLFSALLGPVFFLGITLASISFAFTLDAGSYELTLSDYSGDIVVPVAGVESNVTDGLRRMPGFAVEPLTTTEDLESFSNQVFNRSALTGETVYGGFFDSEFLATTPNLIHNATSTHALPIFYNVWNTVRYQIVTSDGNSKITTVNDPLPYTEDVHGMYEEFFTITTVGVLVYCFTLVPLGYIMFVINEQKEGRKHLQMMSGLHPLGLWLGTWCFDNLRYLIGVITLIVLCTIFRVNLIVKHWATAFILCITYAFSMLPALYCTSFLFTDLQLSQLVLRTCTFFVGPVLVVSCAVARMYYSNVRYLVAILRVFPPFAFGDGFLRLYLNRGRRSALGWNACGVDIFYMCTTTVLYFGILYGIEYVLANPHLRKKFTPEPVVAYTAPEYVDDDVQVKQSQLLSEGHLPSPIELHGVRKVYKPSSVAVHDLWFDVGESQIFGFLGPNGAGKSSVLSCLSGERALSGGCALLHGFDVERQQHRLRRELGFCPQQDALFAELTGREHLELFAAIKGVPPAEQKELINCMLNQLQLEKFADQTVKGYSGGNKRKLSTAIALIGSPAIVCLDEPTTGMDPSARSWAYRFISSSMAGRSVILTTHSMEEAESLCDTIGILCNGRLQCLGTAEHLKSKFGQGFHVDIKPREGRGARVKEFMREVFGGILVEDLCTLLKYKLPQSDLSYQEFFSKFEQNEDVAEYAFGSTTLEQVFLHFAAEQESPAE